MKTKVCSKCKEEKPLAEFYKDKANKNGLMCQCKQCRREYEQSPKGKETQRRYNQSPKRKEAKSKSRINLDDSYVKDLLQKDFKRKDFGLRIKTNEIPNDLILRKRGILKLKRLMLKMKEKMERAEQNKVE